MEAAGVMILTAAYLLYRGLGRRATATATGLLGLGVLGVALVLRYYVDLSEAQIAEAMGVFPGTTGPHPAFAMLAFVAGGVAAVASSRTLAPPLRYVFAADGTVALAALALGLFLLDWAPIAAIGEGGIERWVAYPVVLWLVGFGACLCPGG